MIDKQLKSRSVPLLLVAAIALYPFTASWEFGLGYYLYAIPLALSGAMAIWTWGVPKKASFVKWLGAYVVVASIVAGVYAMTGYVYALKHPPIYVVITMGCVALWHCVREDQDCVVSVLHKAAWLSLTAFLVFWLCRDYTLGEYYSYPCRINQFAMWSLVLMILLDTLTPTTSKGMLHWLLIVVLSFLSITTLSRGAMMGVVMYWVGGLFLSKFPHRAVLVVAAILLMSMTFFAADRFLNDSIYLKTFVERYEDLRMLDFDFFLKDRGYNKVINNPEHLLYGSAEGQPDRFGDRVTVHNSIIGPWFNYGLIGLICFVGFIRSTWRSTKLGWRIAMAFAPILFFHNVTHMFLPYFLLVVISLTEDSCAKMSA